MLSQVIANQLLQDIVDAYSYRDIKMFRRKIKKAKEKIDAGKTGRKAGRRDKVICEKCNRKMIPFIDGLCKSCSSEKTIGRPKL